MGVLLKEQVQAPFPSGLPNVLLFPALGCKAASLFLQIELWCYILATLLALITILLSDSSINIHGL